MAFTPEAIDFLKIELIDALARRAEEAIRPQIPSRRLRNEMRRAPVEISGRRAKGGLYMPSFWAVMVHDGHRSFGPKRAKFLVYFVDEADDPRKPNPERAADVRPLTKEEFDYGIAQNRRLEQVNPGGGPMQHMIVVKTPEGRPARVGPSRGTFFFSHGDSAFIRDHDDIVVNLFDRFVRANVPTETLHTRIIL